MKGLLRLLACVGTPSSSSLEAAPSKETAAALIRACSDAWVLTGGRGWGLGAWTDSGWANFCWTDQALALLLAQVCVAQGLKGKSTSSTSSNNRRQQDQKPNKRSSYTRARERVLRCSTDCARAGRCNRHTHAQKGMARGRRQRARKGGKQQEGARRRGGSNRRARARGGATGGRAQGEEQQEGARRGKEQQEGTRKGWSNRRARGQGSCRPAEGVRSRRSTMYLKCSISLPRAGRCAEPCMASVSGSYTILRRQSHRRRWLWVQRCPGGNQATRHGQSVAERLCPSEARRWHYQSGQPA